MQSTRWAIENIEWVSILYAILNVHNIIYCLNFCNCIYLFIYFFPRFCFVFDCVFCVVWNDVYMLHEFQWNRFYNKFIAEWIGQCVEINVFIYNICAHKKKVQTLNSPTSSIVCDILLSFFYIECAHLFRCFFLFFNCVQDFV